MQAPVMILNANTTRESGRKAQMGNISAGNVVADIIRTCLGPRAMLKMLLDPMGGIVLTNDGNAILREIDVSHPAAKTIIELSRSQDEEVGDGTTSVIILAGALLKAATPFIEQGWHPTIVVSAYYKALDDAMEILEGFTKKIDINNRDELMKVVQSCIGTKFISRWSDIMCNLALDAVLCVTVQNPDTGKPEIDFKRYARIEKVPGGDITDCKVLNGVMINKDVVHSKMSRKIKNPRIILLDCTLEYKKGESKTDIEMTNATDFDEILRIEEEYIKRVCGEILKHRPDIVITEKGISDLAQHYFVKAGVTALRRLRKTDNNRVARAVGATIVSSTSEIRESDVGIGCGLYEVRKIGDEYFSFFEDCQAPKACTVLLRGANKDVLNEIERNLLDAMNVARNIVYDPRLLPGGGATEMALSTALQKKGKSIEGREQWPYIECAKAFEKIPSTLLENCGAKTIRVLTELRAKHAKSKKNFRWGIDGISGELANMNNLNIWEPFSVKIQTVKSSIQAAAMLLRIDDILSGVGKKPEARQQPTM